MPSSPPPPPQSINPNQNASNSKRKRRPAGTPDPDAEVVALSAATLLESDRYVCEICNRGFQRDQNLQMHRRRHKVPWKLLKRQHSEAAEAQQQQQQRKRVYVCPEPSCLHHDPQHALGDLVGIKKHFRRKHSDRRQWVCSRCSKGYAVQSDYKAHLKTCGSRGHSCDCGRVFSRVESFIEHQDSCNASRATHEPRALQPNSLPGTASAGSPSSDANFSPPPAITLPTRPATTAASFFPAPLLSDHHQPHELELQLLPASDCHSMGGAARPTSVLSDSVGETALQLSIAPAEDERMPTTRDVSHEQLRLALKGKITADEARRRAKEEVELAERELVNAEATRRRAQEELEKAYALRNHAAKQTSLVLLQITCRACRQQCQANPAAASDDVGIASAASCASSPAIDERNDRPADDLRNH